MPPRSPARAVQTLKSALRKDPGRISLETQLCRFLFRYCITPHSTTGVPPAELLLGRRPRSRLDLLHPNIAERVHGQQAKQKNSHDRHCHRRDFRVGESVWVRDLPAGLTWLPGVIVQALGPDRFQVEL